MKKCSKCREVKSLEEFSHRTLRSGNKSYQSYCKTCNKAHKLLWIDKNRDKVRWNTLWSKYRLRRVDFEKLLLNQNNRCKLCQKEFRETPTVDHDHKCCASSVSCGNCIRGLLCNSCNVFVGWYENNVALIKAIAEYI